MLLNEIATDLGGFLGSILVGAIIVLIQYLRQGGKIQSVKSETDALADTIGNQAKQIADLKEEADERSQIIKRLEQDAEVRNRRHEDELRRVETANRERSHAYELQLQHQAGRLEELSKQNATFQEDRGKFIERETRLTMRLEEFDRQIGSIKDANNRQSVELQAVNEKLAAVESKNAELINENIRLVGENQQLKTQVVHLQTRIQQLEGKRGHIETGLLNDESTPAETFPTPTGRPSEIRTSADNSPVLENEPAEHK